MKRICIVGSGIAGSLLALELAERGNSEIKIIDIDNVWTPFNRELKLDVKFEENSFNNIRETVGYGFGGTSNLWHGVLADLDNEDYEILNGNSKNIDVNNQAYINARLEKYYGSLHLLDNIKFDLKINPLSSFIEFSHFLPKNYLVKIFPVRFRKLLIDKIRKRTDYLHVIDDAVAIKIKLLDNSVAALECVRNGKVEYIDADTFVLCTGALETPRILMQSLGETQFYNELIGRGLMDHPVAFIGEINLPRRVLYQYNGITSFFKSQGRRIGFRIPIDKRTKENLNHSLFIRPSLDGQSKVFRDNLNKIVHRSWKTARLRELFKREMFVPALNLLMEKFGIGYFTKNFLVSAQLEQPHNQGGYVTLSDEYDRFGRRIPIVSNYATDQLIQEAINLANVLDMAIKERGIYKKYSLDRSMFISGSHHSGTCRMGDDPNHSVIDRNLKYHHLTNLYICDNSIFSKVGNANISFPLSQYAINLANLLSKSGI